MDNRVIASPRLPGGDLIAAVLDREVMGLADRGGASGLVGSRWADLCAEQALGWPGTARPIPGPAGGTFAVERVVRLDDAPAIAAEASRRALQNPDLLLVGERDGRPVLQAADAKFSVETAREKQVSPAVVAALLDLGPSLTTLLGDLGPADALGLVEGVFLCPDFPLTQVMLRRRSGIVRATVRNDQVVLLPAPAERFFAPIEGWRLVPPLAAVDALPVAAPESLLAALYYFRLARAAVGCWFDQTGPLLAFNDKPAWDEPAILADLEPRTADGAARSAFEVVRRWNADVQSVRAQRAAVDQVAGLPLLNREIKDLAARVALRAGVEPPSVNQVRRRVGAWYRGRLRDRFGPLLPPVADLPTTLTNLGRVGADLAVELRAEAERVVAELVAQGVTAGPPPKREPVRGTATRRPY